MDSPCLFYIEHENRPYALLQAYPLVICNKLEDHPPTRFNNTNVKHYAKQDLPGRHCDGNLKEKRAALNSSLNGEDLLFVINL